MQFCTPGFGHDTPFVRIQVIPLEQAQPQAFAPVDLQYDNKADAREIGGVDDNRTKIWVAGFHVGEADYGTIDNLVWPGLPGQDFLE
ncbi:hypothetical protein DXG01_001523 [Tephrocybe rancida]|nr:hypothetical protein DXG01_001523 [Tephrocybe rancida]